MDFLVADNLQGLPGVRHGFFTREWGDCGLAEGKDLAATLENRRRVAEALGTTGEKLFSCYQIHSPDAVIIIKPWAANERPRADAFVTKEKKIGLGVLTADCAPVLFADVKAGVIGAAHAGWRGALAGILENTVAAMEKLGANRGAIHAAIGPCIWKRSYEVGPEFPAPFLAEDPEHKRFFGPAFRSDHYMFDLPGYVEAKLRALKLASVEPSPADTLPDEARFYSYRRACLRNEDRGGSLISVIVLVD